MSHLIDQPNHVGECATCGKVQELEICEDCENQAEKAKAPYLAFWAALAEDAELQRSFDLETECFDSGHIVLWIGAAQKYAIGSPQEECNKEGFRNLPEAIQWCITHRKELI